MYLPTLLGEGVDPAFDDLLRSIAHIGKKLPKLVIDLVMNWRKDQSEAVDSSTVSRTMSVSYSLQADYVEKVAGHCQLKEPHEQS